MQRSPTAPYRVLADWQQDYENNLRIMLPDTFGTKGFLDHAPDWVANWTGIRVDSGDPIENAEIRHQVVDSRAARTRATNSPSSPTASMSATSNACRGTSMAASAWVLAGVRC